MSIKYIFYVICLTSLFASGCVREEQPFLPPEGEQGKVVTVTLKVSLPPTGTPVATAQANASVAGIKAMPGFTVSMGESSAEATRVSDGTTDLHNLWLFQFNSDGSINGLPHKITDKVTVVKDMVTLEVPLVVSSNQTIYLVALGPQLNYDLSSVRSLSVLENMTFEYISNREGKAVSMITADEQIPFAGKVVGAKVMEVEEGQRGLVEYNNPDGFSGGIEIRRLMARITLRYKFSVSNYKLEGLKLLNANSVLRLKNPAANLASDGYTVLEGEVPQTPDPDGYYSVSWYVAQNRQGTVASIFSESDRYRKTVNNVVSGLAPELGTNIEAWASSKTNSDEYSIYQIYVGKNNTNNFDVEANQVYTLSTDINMDINAAQKDERIRSYTASLSVYLCASNYTVSESGGTINRGERGEKYDLDAHYDSRPLTLQVKGRKVEIGIYADAACTIPVTEGDSWLRISSSPNYTEAFNNAAEPIGTALNTQVILPTQLLFYLYSDEYVFEPDGSLPDPGTKRTLYVRIMTTTEGVSTGAVRRFSTVYSMSQRPAVYAGLFGGDKQVDGYHLGLVHDRIVESAQQYTQDPVGAKSNGLPMGYYNVRTTTAGYGTDDMNNGKSATIKMAENPAGLAMGIDNLVAPAKDALGRIELYQYNYYNTFVPRFCYDRNRDDNGNGVLDAEEIKWYQPSLRQIFALSLTSYNTENTSSIFWPLSEQDAQWNTVYNNTTGTSRSYKTAGWAYRCVRDIDPPVQ